MSVDLKKMAQDMRSRTPLGTHLHAEDFEDFARAVAEAVMNEVLSRLKPDTLLKAHGVATTALWPEDFEDLKCEIHGEKEAGNDQG
jgi:hypothetical protein